MKLIIDALIFVDKKAYGYQEYLFNLLNYFYSSANVLQYSKVIIACRQDQKKCFEKYEDRLEIRTFKIKNKLQHILSQSFMGLIIKLDKCDVILSTYNYSGLFNKCRSVLVIHDLLYLHGNLLKNRLMRFQRRLFVPISVRKADRIIAISNTTKEDLEKNYQFSIGKISVVYNYFDFSTKFGNSSCYKPCENPYILSICSTANHKNTMSVLRSFSLFAKSDSKYDLVLVGALSNKESEEFKIYLSLADSVRRRIHLLQNLSSIQLADTYRGASLFISLTLFEGLGMPIVEALYFHIPVLLSDLDICKEVSENSGIYVDPFDIELVAMKMYEIVYGNTGEQYSSSIAEKYSIENTCLKYVEILNSLSI